MIEFDSNVVIALYFWRNLSCMYIYSQIARFMWPTWGPPVSCRPQVGPVLAPWALLSGLVYTCWYVLVYTLLITRNNRWMRTKPCDILLIMPKENKSLGLPQMRLHMAADRMTTLAREWHGGNRMYLTYSVVFSNTKQEMAVEALFG